MSGARKQKPVKLNKRLRSVVRMPCGGELAIVGRPIDGKPGVLLELPEGATVWHHKLKSSVTLEGPNLTPPDKKPYDSP